jgi:hypothetical protein
MHIQRCLKMDTDEKDYLVSAFTGTSWTILVLRHRPLGNITPIDFLVLVREAAKRHMLQYARGLSRIQELVLRQKNIEKWLSKTQLYVHR